MVTNGDRKTNNFGKLVRQKVGLFSSWFSVPFILVVGGSTPRERFCGWVAEAGGLKILV